MQHLVHDIGHENPNSPEVLGPPAWKQIHNACNILAGDCECRSECVELGKAMHDLVNHKLGKRIHFPENFRRVAKRYHNAAFGCDGGMCR